MVETVTYKPERITEFDPNDEDGSSSTYKKTEGLTPGQDLLSYDASALSYMLINSIKEQQAIIEQLKKEQAETKKELAEIKALLLEMNKNK
jgi:phosphoribosylaminoimidazole-succinocarboxamide synthase